MIYSFLITHSETAKGDDKRMWESVLQPDEVLREYAEFGTPFDHFFLDKPRIGASFRAAERPEDGLVVTLETDLDGLAVRNILAEFLAGMNKATSGLCLIGKPVTVPA